MSLAHMVREFRYFRICLRVGMNVFGGSEENGYIFSGSWGALVIIYGIWGASS